MDNKQKLISEIAVCFSRVHNKLNRLEKKTVVFEKNEKLYAAELHAIAAIGNNWGNTVSGLCNFFGTTKGAVSQIISKLEAKNLIRKERNRDNGKEIIISLTDKGLNIFHNHENLHKHMDKEFLNYLEVTSNEKINDFIQFLCQIERYVDHFK